MVDPTTDQEETVNSVVRSVSYQPYLYGILLIGIVVIAIIYFMRTRKSVAAAPAAASESSSGPMAEEEVDDISTIKRVIQRLRA